MFEIGTGKAEFAQFLIGDRAAEIAVRNLRPGADRLAVVVDGVLQIAEADVGLRPTVICRGEFRLEFQGDGEVARRIGVAAQDLVRQRAVEIGAGQPRRQLDRLAVVANRFFRAPQGAERKPPIDERNRPVGVVQLLRRDHPRADRDTCALVLAFEAKPGVIPRRLCHGRRRGDRRDQGICIILPHPPASLQRTNPSSSTHDGFAR